MIINNPKSLAGFNRGGDAPNGGSDYQLATMGQVTTAIKNLDNKLKMLLTGKLPEELREDQAANNQEIQDNMGGLWHGRGYAWINKYTGKIDESLLPSLAITETYVVGISKVIPPEVLDGTGTMDSFYNLLDAWCKANQQVVDPGADLALSGTNFQKGDIIIVTHDTPAAEMNGSIPSSTASYTTEGMTNINTAEGGDEHPKLDINSQYLGTYIITKCPSDREGEDKFVFAKMAYTDSNIISINGIAPHNSAGQMTMYLKDILDVGTRSSYLTPTSVADIDDFATKLERVVFSLGTVGEGDTPVIRPITKGADTYERFSFKSSSTTTGTDSIEEFGYATLNELDDETAARTDADSYLSSIIDVAGSNVDYLSSVLGERFEVNGAMTPEVFREKSATSATVFNQLEALRYSIDYNADMLDMTRAATTNYLNELYNNVGALYNSLNGKAVVFIEKKFTWASENMSAPDYNVIKETDYFYNPASIATVSNGEGGINKVSGVIHWTYRYTPSETGVATDQAFAGNSFTYPNNQTTNGTLYSDERVIAVFDSNGNKIDVDLQRVNPDGNSGGHVPYTNICVDTDYITSGDINAGTHAMLNSLVGLEWTLLIAKTIVNIPLDFTEATTLNVGVYDTFSSKRSNRITNVPASIPAYEPRVPQQ